jgi:hypothetical protein
MWPLIFLLFTEVPSISGTLQSKVQVIPVTLSCYIEHGVCLPVRTQCSFKNFVDVCSVFDQDDRLLFRYQYLYYGAGVEYIGWR